MAAHRYWRLYISRTGGDDSVSVGELILATTPSGAQAATGGTASASSTSGIDEASRAFDGTTSADNYWQSDYNMSRVYGFKGYGNEYLQYDMGVGGGIDVVEVRLYFNGTNAGSTTYPSNFALLYSDDGLKWTLQRAWSGLHFTNGETKTLDATALPSNQIFNRVVLRCDYRHNAAANFGPAPTVSRVLPHRLIGIGARHATAPAAMTPWSGNYYIAGSTTVLGMPFARRVDLVDQRSGLLVRRLYTKADGAFLFDGIGPGPWTLVGVDDSAEHNSVVYAHVSPTLMT